MDTMIAYRLLNAQTQPEFQEVPEPHAAPGQVLVKIGGSGLSHTDFTRTVRAAGVGYDGGHAPYVPVPEARFLVAIGDLDPVEAESKLAREYGVSESGKRIVTGIVITC
jgi:threonine dehydrogenase-like Zn-dependent dehydrogenase